MGGEDDSLRVANADFGRLVGYQRKCSGRPEHFMQIKA